VSDRQGHGGNEGRTEPSAVGDGVIAGGRQGGCHGRSKITRRHRQDGRNACHRDSVGVGTHAAAEGQPPHSRQRGGFRRRRLPQQRRQQASGIGQRHHLGLKGPQIGAPLQAPVSDPEVHRLGRRAFAPQFDRRFRSGHPDPGGGRGVVLGQPMNRIPLQLNHVHGVTGSGAER
jgi:hypothetical protein